MKVLVTGADGFVGRWLIQHLEDSGDEVWRAAGPGAPDGDRQRSLDLADRSSVDVVIAWAEPEVIYHLAAVAFGPWAAANISDAIDVTVRGTAFLLDAAAGRSSPPRVLIPSSSEVYGAAGDAPITESAEVAPVSLYGATKVAQEALGLAYHRSSGLPVIVTRSFNHVGPGQRAAFVVPSLALQLAELGTSGVEPVVRVGNLSAERDFTDVRDVVRAYRLLVEAWHVGDPVNVASGTAVSIREILGRLIEVSGLTVEVLVDPERLRTVDVPAIRGSADRLRSITGWRPRYELADTLADVWRDAKERVASGSRA